MNLMVDLKGHFQNLNVAYQSICVVSLNTPKVFSCMSSMSLYKVTAEKKTNIDLS